MKSDDLLIKRLETLRNTLQEKYSKNQLTHIGINNYDLVVNCLTVIENIDFLEAMYRDGERVDNGK